MVIPFRRGTVDLGCVSAPQRRTAVLNRQVLDNVGTVSHPSLPDGRMPVAPRRALTRRTAVNRSPVTPHAPRSRRVTAVSARPGRPEMPDPSQQHEQPPAEQLSWSGFVAGARHDRRRRPRPSTDRRTPGDPGGRPTTEPAGPRREKSTAGDDPNDRRAPTLLLSIRQLNRMRQSLQPAKRARPDLDGDERRTVQCAQHPPPRHLSAGPAPTGSVRRARGA